MPVELAQVAAGFPLAASFAIAGGITAFREGRRRASLNEAMHELRRPLQVLSLSLSLDSGSPASIESSLRMATAAAERLEREINGEATVSDLKSVSARRLVEAAIERWRGRATLEHRPLNLRWEAGEVILLGDEVGLEQALDNLISNAFDHGGGVVALEVRELRGRLRVTVRDSGTHISPMRPHDRYWRWVRLGRSRHGHGLRIVRSIAFRHGGSFRLRGNAEGTEACLELPLGGKNR